MTNNEKRYFLLFIFISLVFVAGILYIRWPMTQGDVLKEVLKEDDGEFSNYKVKEYPVKNLHEKMGLQLFRVRRKVSATGKFGGQAFFLVNRLQNEFLEYRDGDVWGDFACADYDNDGKYEFLHMDVYPGFSGLVVPVLYVYGMPDGKVQLERTYELSEKNYAGVSDCVFKADDDGKLYLCNMYDQDDKTQIIYKNGKWYFSDKKWKKYSFEDVTKEFKYERNLEQIPDIQLKDF